LHERDDLVRRRAAIEKAAEQPQRLADGQLVRQLRLLQLDAEPLSQRLRIRRPPQPEDLDVSGVGLGQSLADFDRRRLAGAVRAEQAETLPDGHTELDTVDSHDVFVGLAEVGYAQGWARLGRGHPASLAAADYDVLRSRLAARCWRLLVTDSCE
jgi:hypothetical protein